MANGKARKQETVYLDEAARAAFGALYRATEDAESFSGVVHFAGGFAYATGDGGTWMRVPVSGSTALEGLVIPREVAWRLGTAKYAGIAFELEADQCVVYADQRYVFPRARTTIGLSPPECSTWIAVHRGDELLDALEDVVGPPAEATWDGALTLAGKVCRTAAFAEGIAPMTATFDVVVLRRILLQLRGPIRLGFGGGALMVVAAGEVLATVRDVGRGVTRDENGIFTVDASDLRRAAEALKVVRSARMTLPVLTGIQLSCTVDNGDARIQLAATDLETAGIVDVGTHTGKVTPWTVVTGDVLRTTLARMHGRVKLEKREGNLRLQCGAREVVLRTFAVEDFPELRTAEDALLVGEFYGESLADELGALVPFASTDEARPILTSVLFEVVAEGVRLVATDSYRLGTTVVIGPSGEEGMRRCVSARALKQILPRFAEVGTVTVRSGVDGVMRFDCGRERWIVRLIEGDYVNWAQLFPAELASHLKVRSGPFAAAVTAAGEVATAGMPVTIESLVLRAGRDDVALFTEAIDGSWDGEPITVAFNPGYLAECLRFIGTPEVLIGLNSGLKPAIVEGGDPNRKALLMPVRI